MAPYFTLVLEHEAMVRWREKMKRILPILVLVGTLLCGAEETDASARTTQQTDVDAESLFAQARTMLADRTIRDVSAVPEMLEKCAEQGHLPARMLLLDVYEGTRVGIEPEPEKAFALALALADEEPDDGKEEHVTRAERMSAKNEALYRLALFYERGKGCKASPRDALQRMKEAAAAGLPKARAELARYLMNGIGCKPNPREARRLLMELARSAPRTPRVFFYLGYLYMNGAGMHGPNMRIARQLYEMGEQMGDANAINNLGAMYERGFATPRNFSKALKLYKKAAALGCKEASANVQRLAYKAEVRSDTTWRLRVYRAAQRVVQALPISPLIAKWLETALIMARGEES